MLRARAHIPVPPPVITATIPRTSKREAASQAGGNVIGVGAVESDVAVVADGSEAGIGITGKQKAGQGNQGGDFIYWRLVMSKTGPSPIDGRVG